MKICSIMSSCLISMASVYGSQDFFELPPIKYSETASEDAISILSRDIKNGDWIVPPSSGKDFLKFILNRLNISEKSQVLVFSKTSLQNSLISQRNPRALYFSMDAYVGWVPGGKVEIIIQDKKLGPVFYTIDPPIGDRPINIVRATDSCLQCHATSRTSGVPGMFIRSVKPDQNSHPILSSGTTLVTDSTPLKDRWGGWYVTGSSDHPHLGNKWVSDDSDVRDFPAEVSNLKDLSTLIDTEKYLQPTSDIVALIVLEHQCHTHNLLTKAKMSFLRASYLQAAYNAAGLNSQDGMSWKVADSSAKDIVEAFLFTNEVIQEDGVEGGDDFIKAFISKGVQSKGGKSLRDFRLYTRTFKNRCSYMIHSIAFKSLPVVVKERVFFHLHVTLSAETDNHLSEREKNTLNIILQETVPGYN